MFQGDYTLSQLLAAFNKARAAAGDEAPLAIIHRLGAQYAATLDPRHYGTAIAALAALADGKKRTPTAPTMAAAE